MRRRRLCGWGAILLAASLAGTVYGNSLEDVSIDQMAGEAEEAEAAGDAETARNLYSQLGMAYMTGQDGQEADYEKAFYYYDLSGQYGNGFGYFNIGEMYEQGRLSDDGTPDYENARIYYEKAADAEISNCKGVRNIGQWYENGNTPFGQDYKKAAEYYAWAIEVDDASSCYYLGNLYEQGLLSPDGNPDYENAILYYQMGFDKGNPGATGVAEGIYRLGYFYENGIGTEADPEKAAIYYKEAASAGNEDAIAACERLNLEIPEQQDQHGPGGPGGDKGFVPGVVPPGGDAGFVPGAVPLGGDKGPGGMDGDDGEMMAFGVPDKSGDTELSGMISEYEEQFAEAVYEDDETGLSVPYRIFLPDNYDTEKEYPMVVFIGDSSTCGTDTSVSLTQGYGALVWAAEEEECIVAVPVYPETILDDHGSYTKTEYVGLTPRMIESIAGEYAVDRARIYGTGQSMGCMTMMITAAENPELFAACMFVDGQWDVNELAGLAGQTFSYFAAEGDSRAYEGMQELLPLLEENGSVVASAQLDAKAVQEEQEQGAEELLKQDADIYAVTWEKGSTLDEGTAEGTSEHMYAFDFAYKLNTMREWLLAQTK